MMLYQPLKKGLIFHIVWDNIIFKQNSHDHSSWANLSTFQIIFKYPKRDLEQKHFWVHSWTLPKNYFSWKNKDRKVLIHYSLSWKRSEKKLSLLSWLLPQKCENFFLELKQKIESRTSENSGINNFGISPWPMDYKGCKFW